MLGRVRSRPDRRRVARPRLPGSPRATGWSRSAPGGRRRGRPRRPARSAPGRRRQGQRRPARYRGLATAPLSDPRGCRSSLSPRSARSTQAPGLRAGLLRALLSSLALLAVVIYLLGTLDRRRPSGGSPRRRTRSRAGGSASGSRSADVTSSRSSARVQRHGRPSSSSSGRAPDRAGPRPRRDPRFGEALVSTHDRASSSASSSSRLSRRPAPPAAS